MVSIRRRILLHGKVIKEQFIRTLQDHEDRIAALEAESSSDEGDTSTYSFVSYGDAAGTIEWGSGTVKGTGVVKGNYSEAEVLTNTPDESYVGQKFFIRSSAKADGTSIYKTYTDAGKTAAGFWISLDDI